jgi:hypothetical protein
MSMALPESLMVQNLCAHHDVDEFDCGENGLNTHLHALREQVTLGSRSNVFALAGPDFKVVAFMELGEVELFTATDAPPSRYVVVSAVAVDILHQGTPALLRLVLHGFRVTRHFSRTREYGYTGIACITHTYDRLHDVLTNLGFRPDPTGGFYIINDFRHDTAQ